RSSPSAPPDAARRCNASISLPAERRRPDNGRHGRGHRALRGQRGPAPRARAHRDRAPPHRGRGHARPRRLPQPGLGRAERLRARLHHAHGGHGRAAGGRPRRAARVHVGRSPSHLVRRRGPRPGLRPAPSAGRSPRLRPSERITRLMASVREAALDLFRAHEMTTIFGNPGSTELPMLAELPSDFRYVLGLQELVVVGMADGYAQATGRVTHVNLHTAPGVGNAVGGIFNAQSNKSPLLVTAGQQVRAQITMEANLTNREPTYGPQPYVKWSHEPPRAQDV